MNNFIKKIIVIFGIMLVVVVTIFIMFVKKNDQTTDIELPQKEEMYQDYDENLQESYFAVEDNYIVDAEKYGDNRAIACILFNDEREKWRFIPLTDNFLKKYEDRKVLEDGGYIKMSYNDAIDELFSSLDEKDYGRRIKCEKTDGVYALLYELDLDEFNRINDIRIIKEIKLYDYLTGYTKDYYIKFDEENYIDLFENILFPSYTKTKGWPTVEEIDRHNVALTQNFINKYGYDDDIIKYNTPLTTNSIYMDKEKSSFKDRILSFGINLKYENRNIDYKYSFILDKNGFLDDLKMIYSNEIETDNTKYKYMYEIFGTVIIKDSSWERCPLSEAFLNKYNSEDSIFPQYDLVSNKVVSLKGNKIKEVENKGFRKLIDKKGNQYLCLYKFIWNDNNEVDDILTYIVPEDKMNLTYEEMYQLAFND